VGVAHRSGSVWCLVGPRSFARRSSRFLPMLHTALFALSLAANASSFAWFPTPGGDGTGCCRTSCDGSPPYDASSTCTDVESDTVTFYGSSSDSGKPWVSEEECRSLCAANAMCRAYEHNNNNCELHSSKIGASQPYTDGNPTGESCVCWLKSTATEQTTLFWLFERDAYVKEDGFVGRPPQAFTGDEHEWVAGNAASMGSTHGLDFSPGVDRGIWLHPPSGGSTQNNGTLRFRVTERCSHFTATAANVASHCSTCGLVFIFGTTADGTLSTIPLVGGATQRVDFALSAMANDIFVTVNRCHNSDCAPTSDWAVLYNATLHCFPSPEVLSLRAQLAQVQAQLESTACARFALDDAGRCELKPHDPTVALHITAGA